MPLRVAGLSLSGRLVSESGWLVIESGRLAMVSGCLVIESGWLVIESGRLAMVSGRLAMVSGRLAMVSGWPHAVCCDSGQDERYAKDPHFSDLLLFYEYFDGETGRGCGAR